MGLEEDIKQSKFYSEIQKAIVNILFTSNWLNLFQHRIFKEYGISGQQYNILRILRGQHPSPATINLLIDRMLDKMSNASRLVEKLRQKDLVNRRQNDDDRRAVDVVITDKGLKLLEELDPIINVEFSAKLNNITGDEAKTLNRILDKLRENEM